MSASERRDSGRGSGGKSKAVTVPKEIRINRLKEAFKNADEENEGRVDIEAFKVAITSLALKSSEFTTMMLFAMSLPGLDSEKLTYMDFYKTLKKGCEQYGGSAQDIIGNLVMEFGNTPEGRKARTTMKLRMNEARRQKEERAKKEKDAKADIRDIAAVPWAQKDALEPPLTPKAEKEMETQSEVLLPRVVSLPATAPRNSRRDYLNPSDRRQRAQTGDPYLSHRDDDRYSVQSDRLSHRDDDRYSVHSDRMSARGDENFPALPNRDFQDHQRGYHQYSQSVNQIEMRENLRGQARTYQNQARSSVDFRGRPPIPHNAGDYDAHHYPMQDVRDQVGSGEFRDEPPRPHHQHSNSRVTIPSDDEDHFDMGANDYSHYSGMLREMDDLIGQESAPRTSFLHRGRNVAPQVDFSHITNYLRSQDEIMRAKLMSMEDTLRRQLNNQLALLQSIPIYSKKQIKAWMSGESEVILHEVQKRISEQNKVIDDIVQNAVAQTEDEESKKKIQKMSDSMVTTRNSLQKITRTTDNCHLLIGEVNSTIGELHDVIQGLPEQMSMEHHETDLDDQFKFLEKKVEESFNDVHRNLGSKIDNLQKLVVAVALKNGVEIPELDDWEGMYEKLAGQQLEVVQQQQEVLEKKSKELNKIKQEMEKEAHKLKEQRVAMEKIQAENKKAERELAEKEESMSKTLIKLKTERELHRSTSYENVDPEQLKKLQETKTEAAEAMKKLEKEKKEFKALQDEFVKKQEEKLFQIEHEQRKLENLKSECKAEQKLIKAKRAQAKADEQSVGEMKAEIEKITNVVMQKRSDLLVREEELMKREEEIRKVEPQVQSILKKQGDLNKARDKMDKIKKKFVDDMKVKDEELRQKQEEIKNKDREIEAWRKQALMKEGVNQGLEDLESAFAKEKADMKNTFELEKKKLENDMNQRHQAEKKKLAQAAREHFKKILQDDVKAAREDLDKQRRKMHSELLKNAEDFENVKKNKLREIRIARERLEEERRQFEAEKKRFNMGETGGTVSSPKEDDGINAFLQDLGPLLDTKE